MSVANQRLIDNNINKKREISSYTCWFDFIILLSFFIIVGKKIIRPCMILSEELFILEIVIIPASFLNY